MSSTIIKSVIKPEELKYIFGDTKYNEFLVGLFINNPIVDKQELFESKYYTCLINGVNILEKYKDRYNPFIIHAIIEVGKFHFNLNNGINIDSSLEQKYIWDNLYFKFDTLDENTQHYLLKYYALIEITPTIGGGVSYTRKLESHEINILTPGLDITKINLKTHKIKFLKDNFMNDMFTINNLPIIGDIYDRANSIKMDILSDVNINFTNFQKCNIDNLVLDLVKKNYGVDMDFLHKKLVHYNLSYHKTMYEDNVLKNNKERFDEIEIIKQLDMKDLNDTFNLNNYYIMRNNKLIYPETDKDLEIIYKTNTIFDFTRTRNYAFLYQILIYLFRAFDNTIVNKYLSKDNINKILNIYKYKLKEDAKDRYKIGELFQQIKDRIIVGPTPRVGETTQYKKIRDVNIIEKI